MKTILLTTDFSLASRNACLYGVKLAKLTGAKIVLLNVYPIVIPNGYTPIMLTEQELEANSMQRLNDEAKWLNLNGSVAIERRCEQGNAAEVILSVAKQVKASWIVAGLKGTNKILRRVFGGTAYALSRHTHSPLILVPEFASFKAPQVIALASDIDDDTPMDIIDPLNQLGQYFNTTMFIVRVITKSMNNVVERLSRPSRLEWHCRQLHPTYEFLNDNDVAHALNKFVEDHKVDMVALIQKEHNLLERIFVKSEMKKMMIHTAVPLLILPATLSETLPGEVGVATEESRA